MQKHDSHFRKFQFYLLMKYFPFSALIVSWLFIFMLGLFFGQIWGFNSSQDLLSLIK